MLKRYRRIFDMDRLFCLNSVIFCLPFLSACSFDKSTETDDNRLFDYRSGQIIAEQHQNRERFNFQYEYEHQTQRYHIKLTAPFSPALYLSCTTDNKDSLILDILGYHYEAQEAADMLDSKIPGFPWEQLPRILLKGDIESQDWFLEQHTPHQIKMSSHTGININWKEIPL
jgi:outer membrane biogenesis lipoprotein LolB